MPGGAGRSARTEVEADLHAATHGGGARGGLARDGDLLVAGGRRALAIRGDAQPTPAYVAAGACRVEEVDGGGGGPRVTRVWGRQWEAFVGWAENIGLGLLEWLDEWKFGFFYLNSGTGVLNPNYP